MVTSYIPFRCDYNGKEMCRINADCTWTIDWDVILDVCDINTKPSDDPSHLLMVGLAHILRAAQYNFHETPTKQADTLAEQAGKELFS